MTIFIKIITKIESFAGDRKNLEIKVLAVLIYQAGISHMKVRDIFECMEPFPHEGLRKIMNRKEIIKNIIERIHEGGGLRENKEGIS